MNRYTLIWILLTSACFADVYTVAPDGSGDFDTIQDAINYAWHGDTVIVTPGLYEPESDILFGGRAITLTSTDPDDPNIVAATIINGTVSFEFGEAEDSVLEGFTILNDRFIIEDDTNNQEIPAIAGDVIVWKDNRNGNSDIYGLNLTGWVPLEICTADKTQTNPDVSTRYVVWQDFRGSSYDVYAYDLMTAEEIPISVQSHAESEPAVYEGLIVWVDQRDGDTDIYGRDLLAADANEFTICTHSSYQSFPDIDGDIVVWQDNRNDDGDIYGKNLTTGVEFPICTEAGSQTFPAIHENIVVWQDNRNGNFDIYGFDLLTSQAFPVCTAAESQLKPSVSQGRVLWQDLRNGNSDIYAFDLTTATEILVCTRDAEQTNPAVSGDRVIWQDYRQGNSDLYAHDLRYPQCRQNPPSGIICPSPGSAPTIRANTILFFNDAAINCTTDADATISGNTINYNSVGVLGGSEVLYNDMVSNRYHGVSGCYGQVANNVIIGNGYDGIYDCNNIDNNLIQLNGGYGIYQCSEVSENAITNNLAGGVAIGAGQIKGNIIVNNAGPGLDDCDGDIVNNTIVANIDGLLDCNGTVRNNILAYHLGAAINGECINRYNCFWENAANFVNTTPGYRNVLVNPNFVDRSMLDFHLKSEAGRWDMTSGQWVTDEVTSRCIDAGDPADAIGSEPNPNGAVINAGAYGGTNEASKSTSGVIAAVCLEYPTMDFNHDCKVNLADFAEFADQWLICNLDPLAACSQ
ncbi:MAG: hypothetical protein ACYTET_01655 [Planctomycetota bacterium]|jgi:beta propeller repeat protein